MNKSWQDWPDHELVDEAQRGLRGQGAVVEMMRRLRDALVAQQWATNRLTRVLVVFAFVQACLTALQIVWILRR